MASPVKRNVSSGRIARTELDFESARDDRKRRQAEMGAVRLPIALIDSLFAELEIINLAGCCSGSLLAIKAAASVSGSTSRMSGAGGARWAIDTSTSSP